MKKPELYHKTVSILYDAYFNDTLQHRNCYACAVGNIVAANMGMVLCGDPEGTVLPIGYTPDVPENDSGMWYNNISMGLVATPLSKEVSTQVKSTGYSAKDLAKIENAFESAPKGNGKEDYMFNGLVAVLDVLAEIHEVDNDSDVKEKFKKHHLTKI